MHKLCCCCVASVVSDSVRPHRRQPTRLPHPWDSPGKNTGVGCHFLLQCMKVKSESEVAQSCPTPSGPMDHSLPGFSVHGIFQARVLKWVAIAFSQTLEEHKYWIANQDSLWKPNPVKTINLSFPSFSTLHDGALELYTWRKSNSSFRNWYCFWFCYCFSVKLLLNCSLN